MTAFFNFLRETDPAITVFALAFLGWLAYRKILSELGGLKDDTKDLGDVLGRIRDGFNTIVGYLNGRDGHGLPKDLESVGASSPLTLTQKGEERAKKLGAEKIIEKHWQRILLPEDATPMQIQLASEQFVNLDLMRLFTHPERNKIDEMTYNAGGNYAEVMSIFVVLLRDRIFKERGIKIPKRNTE